VGKALTRQTVPRRNGDPASSTRPYPTRQRTEGAPGGGRQRTAQSERCAARTRHGPCVPLRAAQAARSSGRSKL